MGRFGAHIGGTLAAVPDGTKAIGAECVQIFASSPQMWRPPKHAPTVVDAFRSGLAELGVGPVYLHGIYLLNPASLDEAIVQKTIDSVVAHLAWAETLGAVGVVVHLGSSGKEPVADAIDRVAANFRAALDRHQGSSLLLLETCAGQGNTIGRTFDEVGYLVRALNDER
ncbi:MAG: TIM barrel protein, partial [Dehalococcoidia bacterium]|nr:TIM barrel protein [Dehalococcoidia bacterium]